DDPRMQERLAPQEGGSDRAEPRAGGGTPRERAQRDEWRAVRVLVAVRAREIAFVRDDELRVHQPVVDDAFRARADEPRLAPRARNCADDVPPDVVAK